MGKKRYCGPSGTKTCVAWFCCVMFLVDGRLYTCGESDNEQLGHDSGSYGFHQVESIAAEKLVAVSSGNGHTAAVSGESCLEVQDAWCVYIMKFPIVRPLLLWSKVVKALIAN